MGFRITIEQVPDEESGYPGVVIFNGVANPLSGLTLTPPAPDYHDLRDDWMDAGWRRMMDGPKLFAVNFDFRCIEPIIYYAPGSEPKSGPVQGVVKKPEQIGTSAPKMIGHDDAIDAEFKDR